MVSLQSLKEVIVSNEEFILREIKDYVYRSNVVLPETANKVVVFYGVRRCGKTFTLYEIFKKHPENSLYLDFEDDRLDDPPCSESGLDYELSRRNTGARPPRA